MLKCPICKQDMIEMKNKDGTKEWECCNCNKAFTENLTFLGKILRKINLGGYYYEWIFTKWTR